MDKQDWIINIGLSIIIAIGAYQAYGMIYGSQCGGMLPANREPYYYGGGQDESDLEGH